jgi:tetratricopeptide (TPR) repeat protein
VIIMVAQDVLEKKLLILACIVTVFLAPSPSTAQTATSPADRSSKVQGAVLNEVGNKADKIATAKNLYIAKKLDALALFAKNWVTEEPDSDLANFYLGVGLRDSSPKNALVYLQASQKLGLQTEVLMFELGQVFQLLERYDESALYLKRAIELNPEARSNQRQMAMTLALAGKTLGALPFFKRTLELGDKSLHTMYSYGVTAARAGEHELSEQLLLDVLKSDPAYEGAAQTLGIVYFNQKNYTNAVDIYKAGLKQFPTSADLYNNMSNAQRQLKQYPQALASAQKAIDLQSGYINAYVNLAEAQIELGNLTAARKAIAFVIDKEPSTANAWVALACIEHLDKNTVAREAAMTQLESIDLEVAQATRKRSFQLE